MLRYEELISFEPVESVVQLIEADDTEKALTLLKTYVISDNMVDKINHDIIENIQFDRHVDNKGLLIVGNYGSGKSHLMSVISTIAELKDSSKYIRHVEVAEKAKEIEGKFKVIRAEIGAVEMSFRGIICNRLEKGLANMGVEFSFPPADQITNNKDMLFEMMDLFHEKYPNQGLLLVVDELLDYLRGRKEQELTLDLGFLREIGEVCNNTRFRFIAGVQEMLFENQRFNFVADSLRRVKERFKETRIVREDIAFVVSERLLKKNDEQKALIREHLSKFTKLYSGLSEQMELFVNMFPIHPAYLEMFERVHIGEKRVALQTITNEIRKLLKEKVPSDSTGFISFDRYWTYIEEDSSLRSNDRVRTIMEKVITLKGTINTGVRRTYKSMANQIVNALAIHRLTTDDLKTPIGLTSENLRDQLFISHPTLLDHEDDAAMFLQTTIDSAMKNLREAASFQFISLNNDNGQYYINIEESIPVDELIAQRGEGLTESQLDSYYFDVLKKATHVVDLPTYVTNYKIWLHELPWRDRYVKRQGYLFFGAPNERSTAQPERDFYIYMLQAFEEPQFKDEEKPDEVFFRLKNKDDKFVKLLRLYGGANEMYNDTTTNKRLYEPKKNEYRKKLVNWIKDNFVEAYEITYRGNEAKVMDHGLFLPEVDTIIELIDSVAEIFLSQWFQEKYPKYPSFRKLNEAYLTRHNINTYVNDALDYLNGKTNAQGEAILDGLVLLNAEGTVTTRKSGYAKWVIDLLNSKERNQVLNNHELLNELTTVQGSRDLKLTKEFNLEPELLVVLLAALIQDGQIVVTIEGQEYEAMNFSEFVKLPINKLIEFSHLKKPSGLPVQEIQELMNLFDPDKTRINFSDLNHIDFAIQQIMKGVKEVTNHTVQMNAKLNSSFQVWDGQLFNQEELDEIGQKLSSLNDFLQGLQVYDTRAKMMNLRYDLARIEAEESHLNLLKQLEGLQQKINDYRKVADYLMQAKLIVSPNEDWMNRVDVGLDNLSMALKNNEDCSNEIANLEQLKKEYIDHYLHLHLTKRLNATENKKRTELLNSNEYQALQTLALSIELLPGNVFKDWQTKVEQLKVCYHLTADKLQVRPECPSCHYNPREELSMEKPALSDLENELYTLLDTWTDILLTNLNDSEVQESIGLLEPKQKDLVKQFIEAESLQLPVSRDLIQAINTVLKGIHQEIINLEHIISAFGNENPATVQEIRFNVEKLLTELVGNNDENRIRIKLKK